MKLLLLAGAAAAVTAMFLADPPSAHADPTPVTIVTKIGNCSADKEYIVSQTSGRQFGDVSSDTKAGGGGGMVGGHNTTGDAGSRGGVIWSHEVTRTITYVTIACKKN